MFYIYFSALFPNIKWNEIILNGYIIIFEDIMEFISHKSIHINTIIHSKTTSQAHTKLRTKFTSLKNLKYTIYFKLH